MQWLAMEFPLNPLLLIHKEIMEIFLLISSLCSPLFLLQLKKLVFNDSNGFADPSSPYTPKITPKISVFDPFAPSPEELAMTPLCKKRLCKPWVSVAHRLDLSSTMYMHVYLKIPI